MQVTYLVWCFKMLKLKFINFGMNDFFHFAVIAKDKYMVRCLHIHISTEYVLYDIHDIESSSSITWLAIFILISKKKKKTLWYMYVHVYHLVVC